VLVLGFCKELDCLFEDIERIGEVEEAVKVEREIKFHFYSLLGVMMGLRRHFQY
jgi:hypothetical protein